MDIEKERAKQRQGENAKNNKPFGQTNQNEESVPHSSKKSRAPQSREAVGEKVGVSGKTAEQARQNQPQSKKTNGEKSQKQELVPASEKKAQARDTVGEKVGARARPALFSWRR